MAEARIAPGEQFAFNAGRLCLDFVNTVRSRPSSDRHDLIDTYDDLLAWACQATILTPEEAVALGATARQGTRPAADAPRQAAPLRKPPYAVFPAGPAGLPAPASD